MVPPMELGEAVELFIQRASAATATGPLTPAEVATIDTMCRHLEGIPLAIELAAGQGTDPWHRPGRRSRLADRLAFLSRGNRLDPPRHQTLRGGCWTGATRCWMRPSRRCSPGWRCSSAAGALEGAEAVSDRR